VVSSAIASRILFAGGKLEDYQWSYVALFVVVLVIFAGPMLIFVPKLLVLKQRGLMEYGTFGSRYTQAFPRKWVEGTEPNQESMLAPATFNHWPISATASRSSGRCGSFRSSSAISLQWCSRA